MPVNVLQLKAHQKRRKRSALSVQTLLYELSYIFLWIFIFVVPFEEQFPPENSHGIAISRWFGLAAACFTFGRILVTKRVRRLAALHFCFALFVLWAALSITWSIVPDDTLMRVGTYVQLLVFVWLIWELAQTEERCVGLLYAYVFGTCVPAFSTIQNMFMDRSAAELRNAAGIQNWDVQRYTAGFINENDLGLLLVLSIPMTIYLLSRRKSGFLGYLCWIQLCLAIGATLLTGSRASLLTMTISFSIIPLCFSQMSHGRRLILLTGVAGMLIAAVFVIPQDTWERLLSIGTEFTKGTLTHRTNIWAAGIDVFRNHALLGVGAGAFGTSVRSILDIPYVSHNTFLSVLVELGTLGFLIFLILLVGLLMGLRSLPRYEMRFWSVVLVSWAVGVSSLTWEYRKPTWILFGLLAAHVAARRVPVKIRRPQYTTMYMPQPITTLAPPVSEYLSEVE